jgi:hypothetical protein
MSNDCPLHGTIKGQSFSTEELEDWLKKAEALHICADCRLYIRSLLALRMRGGSTAAGRGSAG